MELIKERVTRTFDLDLKLDLVRQIESGKTTVGEVSKIYRVSRSAVYKWLRKYSDIYKNKSRVIVESKSLSTKNKELKAQLEEAQAALGRKQMRIDYLERVLSNASDWLGEDIEKKNSRPS